MIIKGNLKEILLWLHGHVGKLEPSNANTVSNLWKAAQTSSEGMEIDHVSKEEVVEVEVEDDGDDDETEVEDPDQAPE